MSELFKEEEFLSKRRFYQESWNMPTSYKVLCNPENPKSEPSHDSVTKVMGMCYGLFWLFCRAWESSFGYGTEKQSQENVPSLFSAPMSSH